ncbi:MAG: Uncharacterized MFS-type transporter, partial [uncultured Gemmatimonadaceae bacterium]
DTRACRRARRRAQRRGRAAAPLLGLPRGRRDVHARQLHRRLPPVARGGARRRGAAGAGALGRTARGEVGVEHARRRALRPRRPPPAHRRRLAALRPRLPRLRARGRAVARLGAVRRVRRLLRAHRGRGEGARHRPGGARRPRPRVRLVQPRRGDRGAPRVAALRPALGRWRATPRLQRGRGLRARGRAGRDGRRAARRSASLV